MGLALGSIFMSKRKSTFAHSSDKPSKQGPKGWKQKFKEQWIISLMENLEEQFDQLFNLHIDKYLL